MLRAAGRRKVLVGVIALALAVAEGKLLFYSYTRRDLDYTVQGLLLQERQRLAGRQVFMDRWNRADRFVLEHIVGATAREAPTVRRFIRDANRGDFIVRPQPDSDTPELVSVRRNRRHRLCRRATDTGRLQSAPPTIGFRSCIVDAPCAPTSSSREQRQIIRRDSRPRSDRKSTGPEHRVGAGTY